VEGMETTRTRRPSCWSLYWQGFGLLERQEARPNSSSGPYFELENQGYTSSTVNKSDDLTFSEGLPIMRYTKVRRLGKR
jgi:hypothetical protein